MADSEIEKADTPPPPYVAVVSNGKTEPVSPQNGEVLENGNGSAAPQNGKVSAAPLNGEQNGKGSKAKDDKDDKDKKPDIPPVGFLKLVS